MTTLGVVITSFDYLILVAVDKNQIIQGGFFGSIGLNSLIFSYFLW